MRNRTILVAVLLAASTEQRQCLAVQAARKPAAFPGERQEDSAAFTAPRGREVEP